MSSEDQVEELKRLIEAERKEKEKLAEERRAIVLARKKAWYANMSKEEREEWYRTKKRPDAVARAAKRKQLRAESEEFKAQLNVEQNTYLQKKREQKAGRPRPVVCEVCSSPGDVKGIVFDHCHNSNKFRGWLCGRCNKVLGYVRDDDVLLEKLAVYLRAHNEDE